MTPTPPSRWPAHVQQIRKLRRPEDEFVYEPVFVGSFEDAALARDPQHQPRVGGDLRRLPLRIGARRAAAQEPAVLPAVGRR